PDLRLSCRQAAQRPDCRGQASGDAAPDRIGRRNRIIFWGRGGWSRRRRTQTRFATLLLFLLPHLSGELSLLAYLVIVLTHLCSVLCGSERSVMCRVGPDSRSCRHARPSGAGAFGIPAPDIWSTFVCHIACAEAPGEGRG